MKTKMDYINEMEKSNVLLQRELSFPEYAEQLITFQDVVCKMIAGDAYHEGMRIDEATFIMESTARQKGLRSEQAVHNGVLTMRKLSKEMAITMSGIKGENLVSRTLEFMARPNTRVFKNVYVTDGQDQTELDAVVLTDSGIIILEIKKIKSDITITEDGRMVFPGNECHDDMPLCDKMALKRRLLKSHIENKLASKGVDIPVYVDSYIVFSAPKGQFVYIDDRYHREKHCFRTGLNKKLENYLGCAYYKNDELEQLGDIISEMETNVKRFETTLNFDEVRQSLAEAMTILQNAEASEKREASVSTKNPANNEQASTESVQKDKTTKPIGKSHNHKSEYVGAAIASVVVGVLLTGIATVIGTNTHRA